MFVNNAANKCTKTDIKDWFLDVYGLVSGSIIKITSFNDWTTFDNLNTGLVQYLDPDCKGSALPK